MENKKVHYERISINQARKLWEKGETIYCFPVYSKTDFGLNEDGNLIDGIHISVFTNKEKHEDFDKFVKKYKSVSRYNMRYYKMISEEE